MPENFLNRFCKLEKRLQILKNAFTGMQNVREFTATISRACPDFEFFRPGVLGVGEEGLGLVLLGDDALVHKQHPAAPFESSRA